MKKNKYLLLGSSVASLLLLAGAAVNDNEALTVEEAEFENAVAQATAGSLCSPSGRVVILAGCTLKHVQKPAHFHEAVSEEVQTHVYHSHGCPWQRKNYHWPVAGKSVEMLILRR